MRVVGWGGGGGDITQIPESESLPDPVSRRDESSQFVKTSDVQSHRSAPFLLLSPSSVLCIFMLSAASTVTAGILSDLVYNEHCTVSVSVLSNLVYNEHCTVTVSVLIERPCV